MKKLWREFISPLFLLCIVLGSLPAVAEQGYSERFIEVTEKNKVCMVNDYYNPMADFTPFKLSVGNVNYYGCCAGCKATLRENPDIRVAVDPLTSESVDKGQAYIVADKLKRGAVLYFKNKDNYLKYVAKK